MVAGAEPTDIRSPVRATHDRHRHSPACRQPAWRRTWLSSTTPAPAGVSNLSPHSPAPRHMGRHGHRSNLRSEARGFTGNYQTSCGSAETYLDTDGTLLCIEVALTDAAQIACIFRDCVPGRQKRSGRVNLLGVRPLRALSRQHSCQILHGNGSAPDQHHRAAITALGHLPAALNQPGIRAFSWPDPNHLQPIHGNRTSVKIRELRRRDMKRATRGPEDDQRCTPAVRTAAEDAGSKTHLRPRRESPGLPLGLPAFMTPRQQASENRKNTAASSSPGMSPEPAGDRMCAGPAGPADACPSGGG